MQTTFFFQPSLPQIVFVIHGHDDEWLCSAGQVLTVGEAIVLEVVRVTGHSRIAHVGKFALVFTYWDCGVEHKVPMEEPGRRVGATVVSETHARTS
jgi:hypothetical protein